MQEVGSCRLINHKNEQTIARETSRRHVQRRSTWPGHLDWNGKTQFNSSLDVDSHKTKKRSSKNTRPRNKTNNMSARTNTTNRVGSSSEHYPDGPKAPQPAQQQQAEAQKRGRGRPPKAATPATAPSTGKRKTKAKTTNNNDGDDDDDDDAAAATNDEYLLGRKPSRIAPNDSEITSGDFNSRHRIKAWYESLGTQKLAPATVNSYVSQYNKLDKWRKEIAPNKTNLQFLKENLGDIVNRIVNMDASMNTKKGVFAWLLHLIDHFPLTRNDLTLLKSDAMADIRLKNNVYKIKSTELALQRGEDLAYPLESEVRSRLGRLNPEQKLFCLIMLEYPARNDLNVYLTDADPARLSKKKNYMYVPHDETKPVELKINDFKTKGFVEKYITDPKLSQPVSDFARNFIHLNNIEVGQPVFFATKEAMTALSKKVVEKLGYSHIDGGRQFFRRLAASNMRYEVLHNRKTQEDEVKLMMIMMHGADATNKSYVHLINDGSDMSSQKQKKVLCNRIKACLSDNLEFVDDLVKRAKEGGGDDAEDEDEDEDEPAPKRTRK